MPNLFEPTKVGNIDVKNRIFMAPLTRNRAKPDGVHSDMAIEYYKQRASAGLIISEATQISAEGKGYINTPGIYNDDQVQQWKKITEAVHDADGKIICQLWHVGRISHSSLQPDHQKPMAPSAIQADAMTYTEEGQTQTSEPQAMTKEDIERTLDDYARAAQCAKDAGFDGVELHSANGYLIDQFLHENANQRDDEYGGSIENRSRFLFEALDKIKSVWPEGHIGIRLSPTGKFNDMADTNVEELFSHVIEKLNKENLAYVHIVERFPGVDVSNEDLNVIQNLLGKLKGFYMANGNYDLLKGETAIESGHADAISFGRPFIANPDLVHRLKIGAKLNEADHDTFYGGDEKGYTDYPFLEEKEAA